MEKLLDRVVRVWWKARGQRIYREKALQLLRADWVVGNFEASGGQWDQFLAGCTRQLPVEHEALAIAFGALKAGYDPAKEAGSAPRKQRVQSDGWSLN